MKLPADYSDILGHPDMGVRATGAALVYAARLYGPALRAAVAADAASAIPLLGTHARWTLVHELSGTDDPSAVVLAPCDWRTRRDSHCLCWRCTGQEIEVLVARTILAPCRAAGCYWCGCGRDDERLPPASSRPPAPSQPRLCPRRSRSSGSGRSLEASRD